MIDIALKAQTGGHTTDVAFTVGGGVTALIGPSGAGKSTLARLIAGLLAPAGGHVHIGGTSLYDSGTGTNVPAHRRGIGLVPQDSALFPHLSVRRNIAFGCRVPDSEVTRLTDAAGITVLMDRMPHTLSGGEARRVAIVRALVAAPKLLILDEPLTGLDPVRRRDLMALIRAGARLSGVPVILITHEIEAMLFAADEAVLMAPGKSVTFGAIEAVLAHPETARLLAIDDAGSLIEATVTGREDGLIHCGFGDQTLLLPDEGEPAGARLRLRVLARDVALSKARIQDISILNQLPCTVVDAMARAGGFEISLDTGAGVLLRSRITARSHTGLALKAGDTVHALVKAVAVKEMLVETGL